jgi:hypothetical protein
MIEDIKGALTNIGVTNPLENDICIRYCNLQGEGMRGCVGGAEEEGGRGREREGKGLGEGQGEGQGEGE